MALRLAIAVVLLVACDPPAPVWRSSVDACPQTDAGALCCDDAGQCSDVPLAWDECRGGLADGTPCTVQIGPSDSCARGQCSARRCRSGVCTDSPTGRACGGDSDCSGVTPP